MAESDDDDEVEEDDSDGDLEHLANFLQKSKRKQEKETCSESQVVSTGT